MSFLLIIIQKPVTTHKLSPAPQPGYLHLSTRVFEIEISPIMSYNGDILLISEFSFFSLTSRGAISNSTVFPCFVVTVFFIQSYGLIFMRESGRAFSCRRF